VAVDVCVWREGEETVRLRVQGGALVIAHRVTAASRERSLVLPLRKGLLIALREGVESLLRRSA
jgi:hypothetical protein